MRLELFKGDKGYPALILTAERGNLGVAVGRFLRRMPMQEPYYQSRTYFGIGKSGIQLHTSRYQLHLRLFRFSLYPEKYADPTRPSDIGYYGKIIVNGAQTENVDVYNIYWKPLENSDEDGYWIGDVEINGEILHPIWMPNGEWRVGR